MAKKLTYQQISDVAGISVATVSRMFNNPCVVSAKTRERVIDTISALGEDPADYGLALDAAERILIFNVPTLLNQYYSPIINSARSAAAARHYILLVNEEPLAPKSIPSFILLLKRCRAAGVIISNAMTQEGIRSIASVVPTVMCSESVPESGVPFVSIDNESAACNAVKHIASLGRTRVALINGPLAFKYARGRYKGYRRALEEEGLTFRPDLVAEAGSDMDFDFAVAAAISMLNGKNPPDAFFCVSDMLAAAAIHAAIRIGLRVPEDISVVGFDNIALSRIMNPSITTVQQPVAQIGAIAADMIIRAIENGPESVKPVQVGSELIVRESA